MKILIPLFSPAFGTWGGLTRVLALTKAAQQAGHGVAFCAAGPLGQTLHQRGFKVYDSPATTVLGLPQALSARIEARSQSMQLPVKPGRSVGSIWLVFFFSGLGRAGYLRSVVESQVAAARDFQADALFTDIDPTAFLTAKILGLPMATTFAQVLQVGIGTFPWRRMNAAVHSVQRSFGLPYTTVDGLFLDPQVLKIIPSIPELDGTDAQRPDVCYVGSLIEPLQPSAQPVEVLTGGKRCMFVYVGTGSISLDRLRDVLPQVFPADGERVCLVGAQSIAQPEQIAGVKFLPYVPAETVLSGADWTLCHGGQNTIIQSLRRGVPLLVFPGPIFERRFNAQKVAEAGAGRMGELNQFSAAWLAEALAQQAQYAVGAARLQAQIHSYGGAEQAVAALEKFSGR